jgi:Ca2+-binding RTX toxin-like protein
MATRVGSDKADWLIGTGDADMIKGFGGNDVLKGGGGADTLNGGAGVDTAIYADSSTGVYVDLTMGFGRYGTAEGDTLISIENLQGSGYGDGLIGNGDANALAGLGGDDFLSGMGGRDALDGGHGNDFLVGGSGADVLNGGEGFDWAGYAYSPAGVFVSLYDGIATGGDAQGDTLGSIEAVEGSAHGDLLIGNEVANTFFGYDGADTIKGYGGADTIDGGAGRDVILGGLGIDTMWGSGGPDTFVWTSIDDTGETAATADRVGDFGFAEGDRIDLAGIDADVYTAGDQAFRFIGAAAFSGTPGEINYYQSGGHTYIQLQTGTSADVEGVIRVDGLVTPQASWFVL